MVGGEYAGWEMQILVTVVNFLKLYRFKQIIRRVDLDTFVVFTDSLQVMGQRIGNQPHG